MKKHWKTRLAAVMTLAAIALTAGPQAQAGELLDKRLADFEAAAQALRDEWDRAAGKDTPGQNEV